MYKMWIILDLTRRFLVFLVIFGILAIYTHYKISNIMNFYHIQYCPPVSTTEDELVSDFYYIEYQDNQSKIESENTLILWTPDKQLQQLKTGYLPIIECDFTAKSNVQSAATIFFSIFFLGWYQEPYLPSLKKPDPPQLTLACKEPAPMITVTQSIFDYFTWVWTHKYDSSVYWRHFIIYDKKSELNLNNKSIWLKSLKPVSSELRRELRNKRKAVVWFSPRCTLNSDDNNYVQKLNKALKNYNMSMDTFKCCSNSIIIIDAYLDLLDRYYFFLVFESDYDHQKVVAAKEFSVPILNYSRVLPPGSFLDSRNLSIDQLAKVIQQLILNPMQYEDYFKWKQHFTYKNGQGTEICNY